MAAKPKQTKVAVKDTKEVKAAKPKVVTEDKPVVREEPAKSFEERTQELQPWLGTKGVDTTLPDPQVVK